MVKKKTLRVFEGFAGYGGASFGLNKANIPHKVIGYSDIDQEAIELYDRALFKSTFLLLSSS